MPGPSPQVVPISNPGPNGYKVTGGNITTPLIVPAGHSASPSPSVVYGTPLVIELLEGDGLAGGGGEE
jgi:hypothetical protein